MKHLGEFVRDEQIFQISEDMERDIYELWNGIYDTYRAAASKEDRLYWQGVVAALHLFSWRQTFAIGGIVRSARKNSLGIDLPRGVVVE